MVWLYLTTREIFFRKYGVIVILRDLQTYIIIGKRDVKRGYRWGWDYGGNLVNSIRSTIALINGDKFI